MSSYVIQQNGKFINDSPERIDFHIETGDYLSFVATLLGFMEEALGNCDSHMTEKERLIARELREDLRYVQANYKVTPRTLDEVQPIRASGNLLAK